jgi:hypothetical protein
MVCVYCGVEEFDFLNAVSGRQLPYCVPLVPPMSYTRVKRFRKYLQRASMQQSANSVPESTWCYLFEGAPYSGPDAIVRRLKRAPKHIRKKCYDSLPLLTKTLCPRVQVPMLSEKDKVRALAAFRTLDDAYNKGEPFVSYLFALEFILERIGRCDVLPFLNKIQCKKRRSAYRQRLQKIYQ